MASAAFPVIAPQSAGMPRRTIGGRLRLVGPDERIVPENRAGPGERAVPAEWVVPDEWAVREGRVRGAGPATSLTRRGRVVITLVAIVAVTALAVVLATSVIAAAPQIDHATTVSAGQTLSEVAAAQLPNLPINEAVARIQLVNGLNTYQVHAGQSLLIPAVP